jgi:hypothetical protein
MKTRKLKIESGGWNSRSVLECGDMSPISPDGTCRVVPERGLVRALPKLLLYFYFLLSAFSFRAVGQTYSIDWYKVAGGGGTSTGGTYAVSGTIGQHDAGGPMMGGSYSLTGGFWALIFVVQTPGLPNLTITHSGNSVIISWPNAGSYTLQQNSNLATPAGWATSGYSINTANGTNSITITPPTGNLFFRLKQ